MSDESFGICYWNGVYNVYNYYFLWGRVVNNLKWWEIVLMTLIFSFTDDVIDRHLYYKLSKQTYECSANDVKNNKCVEYAFKNYPEEVKTRKNKNGKK